MSTTSFTTCVCLSLVRKESSSATVNPCALLLLLIWYTNFILCVLDSQSNCISVIVAHVKFVSAQVMCGIAFLCMVVTACSMFLVRSSHCLVIQHKLYAFVSPTIFSNRHFFQAVNLQMCTRYTPACKYSLTHTEGLELPHSTSGSQACAHASCPPSVPHTVTSLKARVLSGRSIVASP